MLKQISALTLSLALALGGTAAMAAEPNAVVPKELQRSQLFMTLPDWISTPDGMCVAPNGDLILACPNFGDQTQPGCVARITREGKITKWFDVPVNKSSGVARPMGLDFDSEGNLYIVDNQGWTGNEESVNQGRILKMHINESGKLTGYTEIATGMEHPNGIKIHDGYAYVTQSNMTQVKDPSGKWVSAVYRFPTDAANIHVTNTLEDKNILATFLTQSDTVLYGLDGLLFDLKGNLYVGNFGDGAVTRITFNQDGSIKNSEIFAQDAKNLTTTDGMCIDAEGNIYVADFSRNAIAKISPNGKVQRVAQSPDTNGAKGELDQPGEPIVWNGKLIVSCFDMVTDDGKINSQHDAPQTLAWLPLPIDAPQKDRDTSTKAKLAGASAVLLQNPH